MSSLDETTRHDERVSEIIARYLDARKAGAEQSLEELFAQYREFKKELQDFFENDEFIRGILSASDIPPCFGDDYDALEEIGRGGMGVVYKCRQKSLDKVVAIKTITGRAATDIDRIHKEAQRAAHLPHPNIVIVHDVKAHKGQHFRGLFFLKCRLSSWG